MIILLDQKEYAVGLSWFAISTTQEVEQFQRELDLHFGVLKMSKDGSEQSTVALCAPEYNGQVSLAGMLSFAYQNLLYVTATDYKDDNGQPLFYLCAIKNHAVTVDGDVIGTREMIVGLYNQNYADLTADIDPADVICYGSGVDDEIFPGVNIVEIHQVLDQATRFMSQATIKPLGKKELSKVSLVAVLVLFVGGCWGIYEYFFNQPPPPPPPPPVAAAPVPVAPKRDPYQDFLQQFAQTIQDQPRANILLPAVAALKAQPMAFAGWNVATADFTGAASTTYNISLARQPFSDVNALMQLGTAGVLTNLNVDFAGETATASLPFDTSDRQLISMDTIQALPQGEASPQYFALLSVMQDKHIEFSTNTDEQNPYFKQTGLTFTGAGLWSMSALFESLAPFETLGIKSINVTIDGSNYNWTIEGVIYG